MVDSKLYESGNGQEKNDVRARADFVSPADEAVLTCATLDHREHWNRFRRTQQMCEEPGCRNSAHKYRHFQSYVAVTATFVSPLQ